MQILSFSFTYLLTGVFEKISFYSHDFFINISLTVSFEYSLTFASNNVAQAAQMFQIPPETFACGRQILFKTLHRQKGNLLFMNHDHL